MGKLYFNTEEQLLLNSLCINESKESALKQLDFSINLCKDNELIEVMSDLKNRLLNYTDKMWAELQSQLPFETAFNIDDIVEE